MPACENEDSPRKVPWGGGSPNSHEQGDPSEDISCLSFPVTVLVQRTQAQLTEEGGGGHRLPPWLPAEHTAQTPPTGTHAGLFIWWHPGDRHDTSSTPSVAVGKGWLSRPQQLYQHHHFWALRMLYLSITIATQTTSPRTVGFILWRRKFGRELMAMKSPDYHMPHRQAHPGGCGSNPSPAGSV